jgi:hypothetical protein
MGLLDYLFSGSQTQPQSLLGPGEGGDPANAVTTHQPDWAGALSAISAALRDAGAYMQHQPEAAKNLAAFNATRQKQIQDANSQTNYNRMLLGLLGSTQPPPQSVGLPSLLGNLPAQIALPLILMHAQNPPRPDQAIPPAAVPPSPAAESTANPPWKIERAQ